ncbi:MAG: hypothetical protein ACU0DI_03760 [Paracoccaceae bacterium]
MNFKKFGFLAAISVATGCSGPSPLTLQQQIDAANAQFVAIGLMAQTPPGMLPTANATYSGKIAMAIDTDGTIDAPAVVPLPGGDFRALGDIHMNYVFAGQTISGLVVNLAADEGHSISGLLNLASVPIVNETFTGNYTGSLIIDGDTWTLVSGIIFNGEFKGSNGEFLRGEHFSDIFDGAITGHIGGGFYGEIQ